MFQADYDVNFYRHLVNSVGKRHKVCLTTIRVPRCIDARQARMTACSAFERRWSVYEWRNFADDIEVLEVPHVKESAAES